MHLMPAIANLKKVERAGICLLGRAAWALAFGLALLATNANAQPFALQGVDTNDFRVTTFASGLNFPLGMTQLADHSLLVTVTDSGNFFASTGSILRLTDTNQDGVADDPGQVLYSGLSSGQTSLRLAGSLVLVTGQGTPVSILRMGATAASPLTSVGQVIINYPSGWIHKHSALGIRPTPGQTNSLELIFQVGADGNSTVSTRTAEMTHSNIPGATGILVGDSIHQITLLDDGTNVTATNLLQLASGVRNPAGFAFHPATGDLYFQDNGIDGLVDANEPLSADELNFIARTNFGQPHFFGFPTNYTLYRTNTFVGGAGIPPLIAFQPLPDPFTGHESEGANDITFAPPGFPDGLNTGVFIGFHGKFNYAGTNNEENPVVYADPASGDYFHFILGQQPGIGHWDGLLATRDSLFAADLSSAGDMFSGAGAGVIYQIRSLTNPPPQLNAKRSGTNLELSWDRGSLQEAEAITGPWNDVPGCFSPFVIQPAGPRRFYRAHY